MSLYKTYTSKIKFRPHENPYREYEIKDNFLKCTQWTVIRDVVLYTFINTALNIFEIPIVGGNRRRDTKSDINAFGKISVVMDIQFNQYFEFPNRT